MEYVDSDSSLVKGGSNTAISLSEEEEEEKK